MREFTKEEKEKILLSCGWEYILGYATGYEAPESDNIIISIEEIRKWVGEPAEKYWFSDSNNDFTRNTEDAWECVIDELYNSLDTDKDWVVEAKIEELLKPKVKR